MIVSSFYDLLDCFATPVEDHVVMRAKTIKRWAILIAVLSLIGGTGFFTQRFQITRLAKSVVERRTVR